ncbi:MAG: glutamate--tRNA ligase [Saccharofermentanales bacterium]|jgi:glutamyl-tRNA synthetase
MQKIIRTRFAPSPTGFMHVGNLRSALYEFLVAKSQGGEFILRIEDTDQERLVEGSVEHIYQTLAEVKLNYDEGPDIGGPHAPYVQSERLARYLPYAEQLVKEDKAYYCFCSKDRLDSLHQDSEISEDEQSEVPDHFGYDRHCRDLDQTTIETKLAAGEPYVIRQKMPLTGTTTFHDEIFGDISVENKELEDQILIKSDGYPTYNFANVIDDHEMEITHVVRGSEYLSSTPKYNLLYEAFGWEIPKYVHLPLILGEDGTKLSKRHGATTFEELSKQGYLTEAIINYIAFLGWAPSKDTREIFSLKELCEVFTISGISKSPATFDYNKLAWYNEQYIRNMDVATFKNWLEPEAREFFGNKSYDPDLLAEMLQNRITKRTDLPVMLDFVKEPDPFNPEMYIHKKSKLTPELAVQVLGIIADRITDSEIYERDYLHGLLMNLGPELELKTGQIMNPVRIALSGRQVTPGGSIELLLLLGKEESLKRLTEAVYNLTEYLADQDQATS